MEVPVVLLGIGQCRLRLFEGPAQLRAQGLGARQRLG